MGKITGMENRPIVVPPGGGHRVGNVEFLARTVDTPRFNLGIIEMARGRALEAHAHADEDDSFYIVDGEMTFIFGEEVVRASPGTFLLVPPASSTAFATTAQVRCECSISTLQRDSTAVSACATEGVHR